MALTDQVIMPGSDYQAICDATRKLTSKTATLKSGEISTELETVTPQGETWILGLVPSSSSGATGTFSAIFTSSYYSNMIFYGIKCSAITNGYKIEFYTNSEKTSTILPYLKGWENDNIRKLTFKNPPTDAKFLSWLNVWQGEKQNTDLAVCSEDSITIHNTPYVYKPEHPYDGTKKLNITISPTTQATPSISVNAAGLITASATQSAGYVTSGTKSATQQLPIQAAKTVTPSAEQQTAVASGKYTTGAVIVEAIPTETKTVDLSMVSGNQTISNTSGKYMTSVTVKKPDTLIEKNVRYGHGIGGVVGTYSPHVCVFPEVISVIALLDNAATTTYDVEFWYGDNDYCTAIRATPQNVLYYYSKDDEVWHEVYKNNQWLAEAYRKIVLTEYKRNVEIALDKIGYIQEDKAVDPITIQKVYTSNGSYSILPNAPYDGISEVQLQVDVPSGVDLPLTLVSTQTINDGVITFSSSTAYKLLIAKVSSNRIQFAAFNAVGSINNIGSSDGPAAAFLISQNYAVRTTTGNSYTYTWTVATSSSSDFYENTIEIYGI